MLYLETDFMCVWGQRVVTIHSSRCALPCVLLPRVYAELASLLVLYAPPATAFAPWLHWPRCCLALGLFMFGVSEPVSNLCKSWIHIWLDQFAQGWVVLSETVYFVLSKLVLMLHQSVYWKQFNNQTLTKDIGDTLELCFMLCLFWVKCVGALCAPTLLWYPPRTNAFLLSCWAFPFPYVGDVVLA